MPIIFLSLAAALRVLIAFRRVMVVGWSLDKTSWSASPVEEMGRVSVILVPRSKTKIDLSSTCGPTSFV